MTERLSDLVAHWRECAEVNDRAGESFPSMAENLKLMAAVRRECADALEEALGQAEARID